MRTVRPSWTGSCAGSSSPGPSWRRASRTLRCTVTTRSSPPTRSAAEPGAAGLEPGELHSLLDERQQRSPTLAERHGHARHEARRGHARAHRGAVGGGPSGARLRRWMRQGDEWKHEVVDDEDTAVAEADVDSLLYQTSSARGPRRSDDTFTERIKAYMTKAVKEAKQQTSWRRPDEDFEQALSDFIELLMAQVGRQGLAEEIAEFGDRVAPVRRAELAGPDCCSASRHRASPTLPGHGTLVADTLVDPDNRQPVDYDARSRILADVATCSTLRPPRRRRPAGELAGRPHQAAAAGAGAALPARHDDLFAAAATRRWPSRAAAASTSSPSLAKTSLTRALWCCHAGWPGWMPGCWPSATRSGPTPGYSCPPPGAAREWRNALTGEARSTRGSPAGDTGSGPAAGDLFASVPFASSSPPDGGSPELSAAAHAMVRRHDAAGHDVPPHRVEAGGADTVPRARGLGKRQHGLGQVRIRAAVLRDHPADERQHPAEVEEVEAAERLPLRRHELQDDKAAAGPDDPGELPQPGVQVRQVAHAERHHGAVHGRVGQRQFQRVGARRQDAAARQLAAAGVEHRIGEVEAEDRAAEVAAFASSTDRSKVPAQASRKTPSRVPAWSRRSTARRRQARSRFRLSRWFSRS
jgi:hypothetical protein